MKGISLLVFAASLVSASPIARRSAAVAAPVVDDLYIARLASYLENLENAFYQTALSTFDADAFETAGYASWVRGRISQIGDHEKTHAELWSSLLVDAGVAPIKPCEYTFPITDVASVVSLSGALEEGGGAAYLGTISLIQNKNFLSTAASIATTEHRQAAWVRSAVGKSQPWDSGFEASLGARQIITIAYTFIKSCPQENFDFGLTPYPAFTLDPPAPPPGSTVQVFFSGSSGPTYLAFITGLFPIIVPIVNGEVQVPSTLKGNVYAVVTSSNSSASDAVTLAGPIQIQYQYNSSVSDAT